MSDQEAQENELLALSSIYDDTVFIAAEDGSGGQFCSIIDLPDNFQINAPAPPGESVNKATVIPVKYLPPIILHFQYPADYPSCSAPQFTLSCKWLTLQQVSCLVPQLYCGRKKAKLQNTTTKSPLTVPCEKCGHHTPVPAMNTTVVKIKNYSFRECQNVQCGDKNSMNFASTKASSD
ncbi:E3 ubiquitin-protein ligase RNF14-like [Branchiostoma floridae]|uniref:E3 ubiquitin-protein ligase RNF14-like n=1 Tax=Branchiostoma floridae TaxID=7739 RepID=A0A9J7MNB0_BRAFL|nr:E3 ubiquitin-protein ligase RNF14-like [Branchiostoma floridae]